MATAKQQAILDWINQHVDHTFSTVQLANDLHISLPTLLSFIKAHPHRFTRVKHGHYMVNAETTLTAFVEHTMDTVERPSQAIVPVHVFNTSANIFAAQTFSGNDQPVEETTAATDNDDNATSRIFDW